MPALIQKIITVQPTVGKYGQSLRITIPADIVKEMGLSAKDELYVSYDKNNKVINLKKANVS